MNAPIATPASDVDWAVHARCLWCCLGLFLIRVIAQPLSLMSGGPYLPDFEAWHSGAVSYGALLTAQILILIVFGYLAVSMSAGTVAPRRRVGLLVLAGGATYFAAMLARLVLGATVLSNQHWFARPLPTVFHLVLATFLLVYGHFHVRYGS
jgi:hypothetical protein